MANNSREGKKYFNQTIKVNGKKTRYMFSVGANIDTGGKNEYKIAEGTTTEILDYSKNETFKAGQNDFLMYQSNAEGIENAFPTEDNEKPINAACPPSGVSGDIETIEAYFMAGVISFAIKYYKENSKIKKYINEYEPLKNFFNEEKVQDLAAVFGNGRSESGDEASYIKAIFKQYRIYKEFLSESDNQYKHNFSFSGLKRQYRYEYEKKPWFLPNPSISILYKKGDGYEVKDSEKTFYYTSMPTRSCELIYIAYCASRALYELYYYKNTSESGGVNQYFLKDLFKKGNVYEMPTTNVEVYYYEKVGSNLQEELMNKNNSAELKIVNQGMTQSSYHPFTRKYFNNLKGENQTATIEYLRRSGGSPDASANKPENIIIHYTAGDRSAEGGRNTNNNSGQAAANFYVSTNVMTDNTVEKKTGTVNVTSDQTDIVMASPHECWTGSIGVKSSDEGFDQPFSNYANDKKNADSNRYAVRKAALLVTDNDIYTNNNPNYKQREKSFWNQFVEMLKSGSTAYGSNPTKSKSRYSTSFNDIYKLETVSYEKEIEDTPFREQAKKDVDKIAKMFLKHKDYFIKTSNTNKLGFVEDDKQHMSVTDTTPRWLSTNKNSLAIEVGYSAALFNGMDQGLSSLSSNPYSLFFGGMNLVKQDCMKNLKYLVRYLMDYYGLTTKCLMRHFDHSGKSCPFGFIGDMAWDYLKMYIGGLNNDNPDDTAVNVTPNEFTKFISDYIGESHSDPFEAAEAFAKRWNGITAAKRMEWGKELDALTNGSICRIVSQDDEGVFGSNTRDKVGEIRKVVFETIYYTETEKVYENQTRVPAQSFYKEIATVKFYNKCEIPEEEEEISINERGEALPKNDDDLESGDEEEKKISINEVRAFINKWICTAARKDSKGEANRSIVNDAAEGSKTPQELFDVQNYYDFYSGMSPIIRARFRAIDKGGTSAHWIGMNSVDHPYFESLNVKDNGVKTATLVLYDRDFASYQYGIIELAKGGKDDKYYFGHNEKTMYSLETIIKQAIGTSVISSSDEGQNTKVSVDKEGARITDDFLTFSQSKGLGPTNLRLRWGYCDANPKTTYRNEGNGGYYNNNDKDQVNLTNWEKKLYTTTGIQRTNRWYDVQYQNDGSIFAVNPSRYIKDGAIATPSAGEDIELTGSSVVEGEERIDMSRDKQINSQNSTSSMTPWIDFMITGLKTTLTNKGLQYTITAIESKDGEVMKDRFLQKYAQVSTYPEEVLYILMSIFNEDPNTGEVRKKSPIKLLLFKEDTDNRAFINNELDFANMPDAMKEKYSDFTDTYSLDQAGMAPPSEMEKYLKKITLSFGSSEALKTNYTYDNGKPRLYKSVASLLNEFCAACPPRKNKQFGKTITTEDGMVVKSDSVSEAAMPLKWFTCVYKGTTYVVLYYRRALRPRIIRHYIWGPHNPYQSCVKNVSIENQNEFAILAGIQAFTESGGKETKLKLTDGSQGAFGQGQVDVRRVRTKAPDEAEQDKGEVADFIFTDVKSRNMYQEAYSNSVYSGTMEILGDPFFYFDGLMQPCTYPIKLDVLIPYSGFHTLRGGSQNKAFEAYDYNNNTYYDESIYGNQRRHEISGYYVIKEIEHSISSAGYKTVLSLMSYPQIEYQILDKNGDTPIEPAFKRTTRGAADQTKRTEVKNSKEESIYYRS